ncbi:MAG: response regulator [Desulfobulbaceae bacterium]|nr:response regulator [Desulfobulbaceae bacterium]
MSNKTSILLIEDNVGQRRTLFDILKARGFEMLVAENGAEGFALLKEKPVNLILTDLGLPDISGIDILREVKTIYPAIQVIILTGSATFDSAVEATNLGAFSYLLKPYDIDQLLMHIQRAIEKQRVDEELRISKQMLDDVTQGITESIFLISMDYKILWANRTAIDQAGLTMEQIVGNSCYVVIHDRESACEPPAEPCPLREFLATGNSRTVQRRHDKDGNETVVEVNIYPARDKAGDITGFIHVSRDITERDRLEREIADKVVQLEASLARVRQLEGILPICTYCKKIRDDKDTWRQMEEFISSHSEADFSHGICPECFKKEIGEIDEE